jgi:F0F1-type ATP synthase assembly protein I
MRLAGQMAGACAVAWAAATAVAGPRTGLDVLLGGLGPLVATVASWLVAERVWRQRPEALTGVMIAGFAAKLVFFGAYVAVMIGVLSRRPVPFMASFTGSFIVLHLVEALALRRLFAARSE